MDFSRSISSQRQEVVGDRGDGLNVELKERNGPSRVNNTEKTRVAKALYENGRLNLIPMPTPNPRGLRFYPS